ncbi:MAG: rhomboid family intramembrane serine protease [Candidatus Riflebacteria bacterium]|nr:rhomboid family intramembrane serine protease [Candidatus Riflebacteria bacterium]
MFPLCATARSRHIPIFTFGLILANAVVYWHQRNLPPWDHLAFVFQYHVVPAHLMANPLRELPTLLTSMFLHGSFSHLLGNMWFLWIFGDDVEGKLGRFRFLMFYFVAGVAAGLTEVLTSPTSHRGCIGASGAISGVLGAYMYWFPGATITSLLFLGPIIKRIEIPAVVFLGIWIAMQLAAVWSGGGGNVAWYAHVGGFVAGLLLAMLVPRPK